jgi:hypothetical protein
MASVLWMYYLLHKYPFFLCVSTSMFNFSRCVIPFKYTVTNNDVTDSCPEPIGDLKFSWQNITWYEVLNPIQFLRNLAGAQTDGPFLELQSSFDRKLSCQRLDL